MLRSVNCNQLRKEDVGKVVSLCGWVNTIRNLGSLCFVDLRDMYGITQLNIPTDVFEKANLKSEYCIQATGVVQLRSSINKKIDTGDIEIKVSEIKIFSKSELPPFEIKDDTTASEDLRLQYRYLDLRRPIMQKYLKIRSDISKYTREYLQNNSFLEVDTPTMIKSTPEGARDYLIPSRIYPGNFYALPQSPQLYKQLLMISNVDRYFQLAHCYRDEDQRADRQPEFMQIDCEMAFCTREDVLEIIEGLLKYVFLKVNNITLPDFERMSYKKAIDTYGSDKPDTRFALEINDVTTCFKNCTFQPYKGKKIKAFVVKNMASKTSRKIMDEDNEFVKKYKVFGVTHLKYMQNQLTGSLVKNMSEDNINSLIKKLKLEENDLVILCADEKADKASIALGALRLNYRDKLNLVSKDDYKPLFIIDWPLFEKDDDGNLISLSNPFTRPLDEDVQLLYSKPEKVRSTSYDTVLNGVELSSGALRIYDSETQKKVFELIGLTDDDIEKRFGFFVKALNYGVPPEGGFGIGIERLAMELAKTDNVRDVVAFPKNLKAFEPMSQCPSQVLDEDLKILGLDIIKKD